MDLPVRDGIDNGFFDLDRLHAGARMAEAKLRLGDQDNRFNEAWAAYHDSFDDNGDDIVNLMEAAVASCAPAISPMNLDSTVRLLKELGYGDRVPGMIAKYIAGRPNEPDLWDLDEYSFRHHISDPDVLAAFDAQRVIVGAAKDPIALLMEIGSAGSWSAEDIEAASQVPEDELIQAFKQLRGHDLRMVIKGALRFQKVHGLNKEMHSLTNTAIAALRRIGSENLVNRRRVEQFGVSMDEALIGES